MKITQKPFFLLTVFLLSVLLFPSFSAAAALDGCSLCEVETADGLTLKMMNYRPSADAEFHTGAQPVLLFPGIVCNMNEFLSHTPDERTDDYVDMKLADPVATWATADKYIKEDPMRYYSVAHYLWLKGYDPWLANYRGTGRGDYMSDKGMLNTNLDVWAVMDVPPCIEKVREMTGKDPFIGGHSTGGLVSYVYLLGACFDGELTKESVPHIIFDEKLAEERNAHIKGFIGLDPAGVPPMPEWINLYGKWLAMGTPAYLDLDRLIVDAVNPMITDSAVIYKSVGALFTLVAGTHEKYDYIMGDILPQLDVAGYLNFWQIENSDPYVNDFFIRYAASSFYLRGMSQYFEMSINKRLKEHWKNGAENRFVIKAPKPHDGDGYAYYDDNMDLMTVPAISFFSYYDSLVSAENMVRDVMEGKTPNKNDRYFIVPESSHLDVPVGKNAPTFTFPELGRWLDDVCPAEVVTPEDDGEVTAEESGKKLVPVFVDDDSDDTCFISCVK